MKNKSTNKTTNCDREDKVQKLFHNIPTLRPVNTDPHVYVPAEELDTIVDLVVSSHLSNVWTNINSGRSETNMIQDTKSKMQLILKNFESCLEQFQHNVKDKVETFNSEELIETINILKEFHDRKILTGKNLSEDFLKAWYKAFHDKKQDFDSKQLSKISNAITTMQDTFEDAARQHICLTLLQQFKSKNSNDDNTITEAMYTSSKSSLPNDNCHDYRPGTKDDVWNGKVGESAVIDVDICRYGVHATIWSDV